MVGCNLCAISTSIAPEPRIAQLSVLIVDDEELICRALRRGFVRTLPRLIVEATTQSATAFELLARSRPDVLVVDLNMPDVNGIELCMQLLALPPEARAKVVAMSADASADDRRVLASLGFPRFVPKDGRFVARIGELIGEIRGTQA